MILTYGVVFFQFLPKWDFTSLIVEVLHHFADEVTLLSPISCRFLVGTNKVRVLPQGDVQMSVSLLIVLGDRIRYKIDEQTQELWLMSYIGMMK